MRDFHRQLRRHLTRSMFGGEQPRISDATVQEAYTAALERCLVHMDAERAHPLPEACPWPLAVLLIG